MRTTLVAAFAFVLLAFALIPYVGIGTDEACTTNSLHQPPDPSFSVRVGNRDVQLMIATYQGTLKTLLYWPIFSLVRPRPTPLRAPLILIGAITIVLFYLLAEAMIGARAAILAALLLASDPIYLLTDTFDWGPVAIEHLLFVGGCLLFARKRPVWGCLVFGVALWNKAIFVWSLTGVVIAIAVAYFPEVRRSLANRRMLTLAGCAFLTGMSPLIVYNIAHRNVTIATNVHVAVENPRVKIWELQRTLDGTGLFGYFPAQDSVGSPKTPRAFRGRAAVWIREHVSPSASSLFPYAILLSIFAAPMWWRSAYRRAALFAIVASAVTYAMMFFTHNAGAAIHHTVLLWPMPQLFVAAALAGMAERPRWLLPALGAVLVISNLLVTNRYLAQLARNGAIGNFTDAIYPLSNSLTDGDPNPIYVIDWGFEDTLDFLHWGRLNLQPSAGPLLPATPDESQRHEIETMLSDQNGVFLSHVNSLEMFPKVNEHLESAAEAAGYTKQILRTYDDSNGRPVFEMFRYKL